MPEKKAASPVRRIWQNFRRDTWSVAGLIWIGLWVTVAILGYLITPDKTPNADRQCVEIAMAPPGSKVTFVLLKKPEGTVTDAAWKGIITGYPSKWFYTPVKDWKIKHDTLQMNAYINFNRDNTDEIYVYGIQPDHFKTVNLRYWLGADRFGRDLLSRLIIGSRITLMVGAIAVFISLITGLVLGALAGYAGGITDKIISWIMNVVWSIPTLLLVLTITISIGKGLIPVFIAVGLTMWVDVARMVRGEILIVREKEFVVAGKVLGFSHFRILFKHILPNVMNSVLVVASSNFAAAILIESGLSFLGLGAQPPTPTWGNMIESHRNFIITEHAHLALLPGFAIMLLVLAFTMVSNGLKKAADHIKN